MQKRAVTLERIQRLRKALPTPYAADQCRHSVVKEELQSKPVKVDEEYGDRESAWNQQDVVPIHTHSPS